MFITSSPKSSCSELDQKLIGKLSLSGSDVLFHCALPPQLNSQHRGMFRGQFWWVTAVKKMGLMIDEES